MSVTQSAGVIHLSGAGRIEDAEALVTLLQTGPARRVDVTQAGPLHTAVVQVLLAFRPEILGPAGDPFVQAWLMPLLVGQVSRPEVVVDAPGVQELSLTDRDEITPIKNRSADADHNPRRG